MDRTKFITFEGCEGSGKSTQSKMLYDHLQRQGVDAILTREIGGTKIEEKIRDLIVHEELLTEAELLMVMAARFEHVERVIKPALLQNKWVICDRFIDSTLSYQGGELGIDKVLKLHQEIFGDFMPHLTFWIDLELTNSLARARGRGDENKFEHKKDAYHQDVYNNFKALSQKFPNRIVRIDGSGSSQEVHGEIIKHIH